MASEGMPIVLDNGSDYLKAGYAGESAPRILVPMITTRTQSDWGRTEWFVGEHARALRRDLPISCPVSQGQVTNFDELALVWQYMYAKELRVNPTEHAVLITEYPLLPRYHRERMAEMAFEKFSVPTVYFANQSVLSLYAVGLTTGLSVDIGTETTNVVPVADTFTLIEAINRRKIGGADVTHFLQRLIIATNPRVSKFITPDVTRYFKERLCYVTPGITADVIWSADSMAVKYRAPDGQLVAIGRERFMAPEILFNPKQAGLDGNGIQHSIVAAIRDSPRELQPHLHANIVLSGGGTLLKGFTERLEQEVKRLTAGSATFHASPQRKYSVWVGGSILGSLSTFQDMLVSKKEFEESGPSILHQKFY